MTLRYLRAHCCNRVASIAQVRLIAKLKNQSEFSQTAWGGGVNVESDLILEQFEWGLEVSPDGGLRSDIDEEINDATAAENKPLYERLLSAVTRLEDTDEQI